MPFTRHLVTRRTILTSAFAGVCSVSSIGFPRNAAAADNERKKMNLAYLINGLRSIGKPVCLGAADRLESSTEAMSGFDLHLRNAELNVADAQILAKAMQHSDANNGLILKSFSASYNLDLGNAGAVAIAESFPLSVTELGMVGCSIGDAGGDAILAWAKAALNLQMICIEGNDFSTAMRSQLKALAPQGRRILVIV